MTVPANFKTAISSNGLSLRRWLEIAGIPICYGNFVASSAWFAARAAADQFDEIRPYFKRDEVPANFDGELDPLDAIAKAMGQIEFSIVDYDGIPTTWAGNAKKTDWVYLAADITAAATVFNVTPSVNPGVIVGDYLYVGAETMKVTAVANGAGTNDQLTVLRGRFRSKAKAFGAGFPLAKHPYTMKGRKAWYYQTAVATGGTHVDADKALRFSGTVETFRLGSGGNNEGPGYYVLGIQSLEKLLSREVFRDLRSFTDGNKYGLSSPPWSDPGLRPSNAPGGSSTSLDLHTDDYKKLTDFEVICARVDDEFIGIQRNGTKLNLGWRGLFNTDQDTHRAGFTAKEVAWIAAYDSQSQYLEHANTRFTSVPTTASPLPADHPLLVLLQVMLSTGDGTNFAGGGPRNYDVLPKTWGLGIDYTRVDIAGIEKLAGDFPSLRACGVVEDSLTFVEFARKLLQPFGFYAITTIGDLWTIRYLRPPLPDETTRTLDNSKRISKQTATWDANLSGVVQEVVFKYGWDPTRKIWRYTVVETFADAQLYAEDDGRRLTFEMPHLYPTGAGLRGKPPIGGMPNLDQLLKDRGDFYRQRYARPPAVITEKVDYSFLDIEVGDLISSNHNWLPNASSGLRKLIGSLQQLIKKAVDDRSKTLGLTLLDSGYNVGDYRFISPAFEVESISSQTRWTFKANSFTEATLGGLSQTDGQVRDSNGAQVDTFVATQNVRLWKADFSASESLQISSINMGIRQVLFVSGPAGFSLAAGQFLTYEDYDTDANLNTVKSIYAWLANSSQQLGAANDRAHTYFP